MLIHIFILLTATFTGSFIRNKRPSSTWMGFKTNLALVITSRAAVYSLTELDETVTITHYNN